MLREEAMPILIAPINHQENLMRFDAKTLSLRRAFPAIAVACISAITVLAHAEVTSPVLLIDADAATAPVTVQKLRGNISVLMGSGGNIAVLNAPDGKLLGDAGIAVSKPRVEAALASISAAPLKYVINTHYHWDHTNGNAWMNEAGATIVAHENTLKRLTSGTRVIEWGFTFPPSPKAALPTIVFQTDKTIEFGGETIVLKHFGPGHTDTDALIYFKKADILQVGDIWWNGHYPFLDNGAGGSIDGLIRWVNECIKLATAKTIIIPGHGAVSDRAGLTEFRDMLVAIRANVARLKREGKTLAETVAAKPTAVFDAKYGDYLISPAFFIQLVYMDV
jgi:glyoxylase-like metal-dependent hydrolase (beta-lactamase superfamily II)